MSRSDTDADSTLIHVNRPMYELGREVSFMPKHGYVFVGVIKSSRQVICKNGAIRVSYEIQSSGMIYLDVPEENILKNPQQHNASRRW